MQAPAAVRLGCVRLGAIGGATALALAAVLALTAVVVGLAPALAFTVVLAFAGMLVLVGEVDRAQASFCAGYLRFACIAGLGLGAYRGSTQDAGNCRGKNQCFHGAVHWEKTSSGWFVCQLRGLLWKNSPNLKRLKCAPDLSR